MMVQSRANYKSLDCLDGMKSLFELVSVSPPPPPSGLINGVIPTSSPYLVLVPPGGYERSVLIYTHHFVHILKARIGRNLIRED